MVQPEPTVSPVLWRRAPNRASPKVSRTPIFGKLGYPQEKLDEMAAGILKQIPLGRFGTPREIADAAVFLASDESTFLLGSEIVVDGGLSNL